MLMPHQPDGFAYQVWVVDLQTGQAKLTPFEREYFGSPEIWRPGALVLPGYGQLRFYSLPDGHAETLPASADHWNVSSPDGRYVAGFRLDHTRGTADSLAPATVAVFDLVTRREQVFPDIAHGVSSQSEKPPLLPMHWDEQGLVVQDITLNDVQNRKSASRLLRLDQETGTWSATDGALPGESWAAWVAGPGGWQVDRSLDWGPVRVKRDDGPTTTYGEGKVVGFTPDGRLLIVRWPNAKYHRVGGM